MKSHFENSQHLYWKRCRPSCSSTTKMTERYFCKLFMVYLNTKENDTWLTPSHNLVSQFVMFSNDALGCLLSACQILK